MKVRTLGAVALLFASAATPPTATADPVTAIAAGAAVDNTVDGIKNAAQEIIQQLESSVGMSSFRGRQDMAFLIAELNYFATQHRNAVFKDLNASEKRFLTDANNLVLNTAREVRGGLRDADRIAGTLESGIARLPLADRQPRISRSAPEYILDNTTAAPVRITATGSLLSGGRNPRMTVAGKACAPIGGLDTSLAFSCDGAAFRTTTGVGAVTADLTMQVDQPWYLDIWRGLTGKPEPTKAYKLLVYVVPRTLGTYRVEGVVEEDYTVSEERSGVVDANNQHCWGERRHGPFRFTPREGWKIDSASIHEGGEHSGNGGRSLNGPLEVAESGFVYYANLKNSGDCGPRLPFSDRRAYYDGRAWINKDIIWTEIQPHVRDAPLPITTGPMNWSEDIAVPLPERWKQVSVTVDQFDGQHRVMTGDDAALDWFSVSIDPNRRMLVIRPRSLDEAMARN